MQLTNGRRTYGDGLWRQSGSRRCSVLLAALFACVTALRAQPASADNKAYGVTDANVLVRFDTTLSTYETIGPITGLFGAETILAIDYLPLNGRLYGISASHLYQIDTATGAATAVSPTAFASALMGAVGMDADPANGTIRVITDTGQNLRVSPVTGAVVTDTSTLVGIAGLAFTNNFATPDRATLFGINATTDQLVRIGGVDLTDGGASQSAGVVTPIGNLGFNTDASVAFDIAASDNRAWAIMAGTADLQSSLFSIDLTTGTATPAGTFTERLHAIALVTRAVTLYGLTANNTIVTFLSAVPGTLLPQPSGSPIAIQELTAGENVLAIDVRPSTGELYGVTSTGRLLVINPATGGTRNNGTLSEALNGTPVGIDFDPVADRLRITTDTGQNMSVNPANATVTLQTTLSVPETVALAYTPAAVASTTLYGIDGASDRLLTFATPSNGVGTLSATLGIDAGALTGFDVSAIDGTAFLSITAPSATSSTLYTISLPTGVVKSIGPIGGGAAIRGLAAATPGFFRLSQFNYDVLENIGTAFVTVERIGGTEGTSSVRLRIQPTGTASAPGDFLAATVLLEFASGETSKTVGVTIVDDPDDESNETIGVTLSDPQFGVSLVAPDTGTITIVDNDPVIGTAAPAVTIATPTNGAAYTASSLMLTLGGSATDDTRVESIAWSSDRGPSGSGALNGAPAATVEWIAANVPLSPGVNTITIEATDNDGNKATDVLVVTLNDLSYFLAEGATGGFFDLDLLLVNPNTSSVTVTATFLKPLGLGTVVQHYTLPAHSRRTIQVDAIPGLEEAEVSTIVTAPPTHPIVVERTMRWNSTGYGAHTDKASPTTSQKWFFAEGSQGFFSTYLLLANPQTAVNEVTVRYLREGATPVTRAYTLQPLERHTVDLSQDAALVNTSFGMEVTFTHPGIAERAMYFGLDPLWIGGHESVGVTQPSREWFLAEGATGTFFETFVLFANPGASTANVDVRYLPAFGSPVDKTYTVEPQARLTVNIEIEDPTLSNAAVATQVTSDVPILVERAQYWPGAPTEWYETHNSFGVTSLGQRWGFAEGRVGGPSAYQTYILVANPNSTATQIDIDFLPETGTPITKTFSVPAESRLNVQVGVDVPEITTGSFGAVIRSAQPIAVERAMYSNATGQTWQAGTNATGTLLPVLSPVP